MMHYYRVLPGETAAIRSWTIYDLVDDWVLHSSMKPGIQIMLFLFILLSAAGLMLWMTLQRSSFPPVSIGVYVFIQLVSLFGTIIIHELCHAFLIIYYGGRPRFGWKWMRGLGPVVYATASGYYTVHAYRRISAAPLVTISIFCFVGVFFGIGWWLIIPFIFNAIGAGGDLLGVRVLKQYPSNFLIEDTQDGFTVFNSGPVSKG